MGLGMGLVMSPMSTAAMNAVEPSKAGVASGILSMSRMVGGTFGVAAMGALVTGLGKADARRPAAAPARRRAPEAGRRARRGRRPVPAAPSATPSRTPSSTRSTTACASARPSPLLGALLAWMLIADAPRPRPRPARGRAARPRAPRPRRRWPRSSRPGHRPAPRVPSRRRMHVLDTVDCDAIRGLHQRGEFFWLDLDAPSDGELEALGEILDLPDWRSRTARSSASARRSTTTATAC